MVNGTGFMDCTYHYYLSGQSVIEERNGSDQVIKQYVQGSGYVDEIVQEAIDSNPIATASWLSYYPLQDAKHNVLGSRSRRRKTCHVSA